MKCREGGFGVRCWRLLSGMCEVLENVRMCGCGVIVLWCVVCGEFNGVGEL